MLVHVFFLAWSNDSCLRQTTGSTAAAHARADSVRADKSRLILNETYAPKIRVDLEVRYGSMQTTNSKRTAAVDQSWKQYKAAES